MRAYILGEGVWQKHAVYKQRKKKSGAKNKPPKMPRLSFFLLIVHRQASNVAEIRLL